MSQLLEATWDEEVEQRGVLKGALAQQREDLLEALSLRFGSLPGPLEQSIAAETDLTKLKQLFRSALRATSLDELQF